MFIGGFQCFSFCCKENNWGLFLIETNHMENVFCTVAIRYYHGQILSFNGNSGMHEVQTTPWSLIYLVLSQSGKDEFLGCHFFVSAFLFVEFLFLVADLLWWRRERSCVFGKGALGGGECWEEQKGEGFFFQTDCDAKCGVLGAKQSHT